jgi:hypothetical protein
VVVADAIVRSVTSATSNDHGAVHPIVWLREHSHRNSRASQVRRLVCEPTQQVDRRNPQVDTFATPIGCVRRSGANAPDNPKRLMAGRPGSCEAVCSAQIGPDTRLRDDDIVGVAR